MLRWRRPLQQSGAAAAGASIVTDLGIYTQLFSSNLLLCKDNCVAALLHILCTQVQHRLTAGSARTGAGWVEGLHSHPQRRAEASQPPIFEAAPQLPRAACWPHRLRQLPCSSLLTAASGES